MSQLSKQPIYIQPEAPDALFLGLLSLLSAAVVPLEQGRLKATAAHPNTWALVGVSQGGVLLTCREEHWHLTAGQAAVISGTEGYTLLAERDCTLTVLRVTGAVADRFLNLAAPEAMAFFPHGGKELRAALTALRAENPLSAGDASAVVYRLLARLHGHQSDYRLTQQEFPEVVEDALGIIQQDFAFLEGVSDLADRLGVSREYLIRTFRACVGVTPGQYLTRTRIEYAKRLLGEGATVAFTAGASGFSTPNYFCRVFHGATGLTPSQFARRELTDTAPADVTQHYYVL